MNSEQIEKLLQKGPDIRVPDGLLVRLKANIRVPRTERSRPGFDAHPSWLRRWMPALALTSILLLCMVAVAVQTNIILELQHQNEALRAATGNLEALRTANAEYQKLSAQNQELERLRKDNAELQKLRVEVVQLTAQAQEAEKLRVDNKQLQAQITAKQAASGSSPADDYFGRLQCVDNLKHIGISFRLWAEDNNQMLPPDFLNMTNELGNATGFSELQCPSDKSRAVTSWADVAAGNISYRLLAPGIKQTEDPDMVVVECPIHHAVCLIDGSVQLLSEDDMKYRLKVVNGRKVFVR